MLQKQKWFWKKVLPVFLSDILLVGFATTWLFIFILILVAPDHTIWVGEDIMAILLLEIGVCVLTAGWALRKIYRLLKRK